MRSLQPATTLALLVALLVLAGMGTVFVSTATPDEQAPVRVPNQLVEPKSGNNVIWAYTSRDRTATERTLPINVIVHGDADDVRYYLTDRIGATWNETDEEGEEINPDESAETGVDDRNATVIEWAAARGATRYMYVHNFVLTEERTNSTTRRPHRAHPYVPEEPYEASGQWIESTYQLHDGDYFGTRHHLRVYESPYETDDWVAIQAHQEHWDWFQLRHTVDGIEDAQSNVESEFMGRPYVDDVWRMHLENDRGADADGWATVIELESLPPRDVTRVGPAAVALVFVHSLGRVTPFRGRNVRGRLRPDVEQREDGSGTSPARNVDLLARIDHRHLLLALRVLSHGALFGVLLALYLAVRAGGILLEQHYPTLPPRLVVWSLYPIIVLGLPVCAYVLARAIDPGRSFVLASAGLGTAIVADYAYLHIAVLPIDVVLHRLGVVVAIGLIAAGASNRWSRLPTVNRWLGAGVLSWVFLVLAPLVGWM